MTRFERRWITTIFETILPQNAHPILRTGARDLALEPFYDTYVEHLPRRLKRDLRLIVWVLTWFPLFFIGMPLPLHWLSERNRTRYLEKITTSRIYLLRQGMLLLKSTIGLEYFRDPRVRAALGIPYSTDQVKVLGLPSVNPMPASEKSLQPSAFSLQPDQDQQPSALRSEPKTEDQGPKTSEQKDAR